MGGRGWHHSNMTKQVLSVKNKGARNPNWKGGKFAKDTSRVSGGYIYVYRPEHPYCTKAGYVFRHRLVMEEHLGRYLKPEEKVHHRNGIKKDNKWWNLEVVTKPHYGKVECPYCGEVFLIR